MNYNGFQNGNYSKRTFNEKVNERMNHIMDAMYAKLNWTAWRPEVSEWDKRGIDVILRRPGSDKMLWVDEKAATSCWNRNLNTFACELTCNSNVSGYGWFAKEQNDYYRNTHLGLIWVRALEPECIHISHLTYRVINKADLQNYFLLATGMMKSDNTKEFLDSLTYDQYGKCKINDDLTIKRCNLMPEQTVVAIFSENILSRMCIFEQQFSRYEVRDALREARKERELQEASENNK